MARYWEAFPDGEWLNEAIERAEREARVAARVGCLVCIPEDARRYAAELRATLQDVRSPRKEELLRQIGAIEDACTAGSGPGPSAHGSHLGRWLALT